MGRLEVRVCGARHIGDTQKVGIPDPYVKIIMGDRKKTQILYKSKVVNNNLNPVWNELAKFQIADYDSAQIVFEVWNDNVMVDDLLGSYALSVNGLQRGVVHDMWAILTGAKLSSAEIHLQVLAVDFGLDPAPGSRCVGSIEEYINSTAAKPVMSATEANGGADSPASASFDPVSKPSPAMGIPLQAAASPPAYAQPQQAVQYVQQQPVQYVQQAPPPLQPQPQVVYVQQAPPPPQQVVYMQQPPQQPVYYQQGPPPPAPQGGYYGPSPPQQPYYYGPTRL
ncbi:putative c2 domain protein [Leptomonas pyrrhocoris]|uniref:Putative c2 domain protein n=1 Tax=Leptomonas pyrrhocoris TaxID=157538 RepID=A0A0M9FQH4_LEPPY|nr:putative c2 domain protein [Leptomonas pyrrhocoris]XP_015652277.1 putative c2 domain protein [Leptomonas pyrrhocoris]XP_015652278.1 putative c2 domain protein [Leptomonas pyrrhocoris]KPA73837.1 putative c2 domain protein [Leptomonas pyrrhocoris]KPA73838.1 putative c2 domain protein [Leptomonas pyrrhocoris]KPA73839.1 putative c2 domain protein [Leptomonas pyrrhocoris]|eukprot:XP_015652276.1 putative c2 domain protein [Leptomonas pyrrhocoris]